MKLSSDFSVKIFSNEITKPFVLQPVSLVIFKKKIATLNTAAYIAKQLFVNMTLLPEYEQKLLFH